MNLQLINPYQIIKELQKENEQLKEKIAELEREKSNDSVARADNR